MSGRRRSGSKLSRSGAGSGETPVTKTGTGPWDDACVHVGRTYDGGETRQRKPGCNRQQGRAAPSHAATYKLAIAKGPHMNYRC